MADKLYIKFNSTNADIGAVDTWTSGLDWIGYLVSDSPTKPISGYMWARFISPVADNLISLDTKTALSANQGRIIENTKVDKSTELTINGVTHTLETDRVWNINAVALDASETQKGIVYLGADGGSARNEDVRYLRNEVDIIKDDLSTLGLSLMAQNVILEHEGNVKNVSLRNKPYLLLAITSSDLADDTTEGIIFCRNLGNGDFKGSGTASMYESGLSTKTAHFYIEFTIDSYGVFDLNLHVVYKFGNNIATYNNTDGGTDIYIACDIYAQGVS